MSKPRGDSKLDGLTEDQKQLLIKWLFDDNCTYSVARSRCLSVFGLQVSLDALGNWRQRIERERTADRALKAAVQRASESAVTATAIVQAAEELKEPWWNALVEQIGQEAFELKLKNPGMTIEDMKALMDIASIKLKARHDTRAQEQKDVQLQQSDRRIKLLEEREAKTKNVVQNTALTPEEKEAAVKQILGIG